MEPQERPSKTTGRLADIERHVKMVLSVSPDLFASLQIEPIGGALTLDVSNYSGIFFGLSTRAHPERGIFADARVQIGTDIQKALLQFFERQSIKVTYDPEIPPHFLQDLPMYQLYSFEEMASFPQGLAVVFEQCLRQVCGLNDASLLEFVFCQGDPPDIERNRPFLV